MKTHLTERFVSSYPKPGKRTRIFDDAVTGFYLEVTPNGVRTFYLWFRTKAGKAINYRIGRYPDLSVASARKIAKVLRSDVSSGVVPPIAHYLKLDTASFLRVMEDLYGISLTSAGKRQTAVNEARLSTGATVNPSPGDAHFLRQTFSAFVNAYWRRIYAKLQLPEQPER